MIINEAKLYDREYVEKILIISMSIVIRDKHIGPGHSSPYPLSMLTPVVIMGIVYIVLNS